MMSIQLTCSECGSGVHIYPSLDAKIAECEICKHQTEVQFTQKHVDSVVEECPCCQRKDFYSQKDFNRKIGVLLFVFAAILSIWTYGISLIILYLFDLVLFRKLGNIVVCYKCQTIFRGAKNGQSINGFDHEMNDRIIYSGHDFGGKPIGH